MVRTYYRDEEDNTSPRRDNGLAAWGLLIIPLFLLALGFGAFNMFTSKNREGAGKTVLGIGGSAPTSTVTPTRKPSVTATRTPTTTPKPTVTISGPTTEYGVGGSPGDDTVPNGAPNTGGGAMYEK